MAVQFKVPKSPKRSIEAIDYFRGADFTNSPANVHITRSPNCVNMVRDVPGKLRKALGWHTITDFELSTSKVNGCFYLDDKGSAIAHVGTKLFYGTTLIYSAMNDGRSRAWQFGDRIYIIDGAHYLVYYQTTVGSAVTHHVESASIGAKIPIVTISKDPEGGGTPYEDLNLIQPGFTEQFLGKADVKDYQLSFKPLDATEVTVQLLNAQGEWEDKTETTDFTVDRTNGVVTFGTAPGVSPITGEDNVKITAYRTVSGYADRINKCTIGILYGIKGGKDRLFLSGNPDMMNYDWYSESYDPTYFKDTSYSRLGGDASAIIGYSIISSRLATHKNENDRDQNIIVREGTLDSENNEIFVIKNSLQGVGAIAKDSFGYLESEPLFLTNQGVFAVTAQDITGEKYSQNRSFYINGKLLNESHLEKAFACVFNDNYMLCVNGVMYILDGLQPTTTDKGDPYSNRQYAGFYRTNVPANTMWVHDNELYFGTNDGRICKFYKDKNSPASFNDDNEPIVAVYETPDIDGELFYKNKTLRYLALRVEAAVRTSVSIYAMVRGVWEFVKFDNTFGNYFSFSLLKFSEISFSGDQTQKICRTKMRVKKVDKFRIRFINDAVDEPFTIQNVALEYVEKGYFKG